MQSPKLTARKLRRQTRNSVSRGRRTLLLESLEGRRLLAADGMIDLLEVISPAQLSVTQRAEGEGTESNAGSQDPFVFNIAVSAVPNSIRLVVGDGELQVWDQSALALLEQVSLESISDISVIGSSGPDRLILDFQNGGFGVPVQFDGAEPTTGTGDEIILSNGSAEQVMHQFDSASSGQIDISGTELNQEIHYTGLEPVADNLNAVDRVFTFTGGAETIVLSDDGGVGDNFNRIDSTLGEVVTFLNPTNSLTINAGTGNDIVEIERIDSSSSFPVLNVNGDADADQIFLRSLPVGIAATLSGGTETDLVQIGSAAGSLDPIMGMVTVNGDAQTVAPDTTESVTAKGTTVTVSVADGDRLLIDDTADIVGQSFSVTATSVTRIAAPVIQYATIETLDLQTGTESDLVTIAGTAAAASVNVATGGGGDVVDVISTGDDGILILDTGAENDIVSVSATGARSVARLILGAGDDDASVTTTGLQGGLDVNAEGESDLVTLAGTGNESVTAVSSGSGADIVNVRSTGQMSVTDVFAGSDNDTINVSSDADGNRLNPSGNPAGDLDGLLGALCVDGEDSMAIPEMIESVTVKGNTVTATVPSGDELNISDQGSATHNMYSLNLTEFARVGDPVITYSGIETLNIESGSGDDSIAVSGTQAATKTTFQTNLGEDSVIIDGTGDGSILIVDTGLDNDSVSLFNTGATSVTRINTRDGDDDVFVTMTGLQSGLDVSAGLNSDLVTIAGSGTQSITGVRLASGDDIVNIRGTGDQSVTDVNSGSDNDTINVSSDADGDRLDPSGAPAGNLDGLLGQLCVNGNSNAVTPDESESVTVKGNSIIVTVRRGDELNLSDQASVANHLYSLSLTEFERIGLPPIIFNAVETLNIETGGGADEFAVTDTNMRTNTTIETYAGNDEITIDSTGDFSIVNVDAGVNHDSIDVTTTGESSFTGLLTGDGEDDIIVRTTGVQSGLDIDMGDDNDVITIVSTGSGVASVALGSGDDVANVRGSDADNVMGLSAGSGTDTFNVTSTADGTPAAPTGDQTGDLDDLLGEICVFGDGHISSSSLNDSVSARQTDGDLVTNSVEIELADVLNLSDAGSVANNDYLVTATTIERTSPPATGVITYETVETVNLLTGTGDDTVGIQSTAASTEFNLRTDLGIDTVGVQSTGPDSLLAIETDDGNDIVTVDHSGDRSLVSVQMLAGEDTFSINSIGDRAGVKVDTGSDPDQANLNQELSPPARTGNAIVNIAGGSEEDLFVVDEVFLMTVVDLNGDEDNDIFNLNADASDPTGYLGRLNDDPNSTPTDDAVAATRQLFIDGGANGPATTTIHQGVSLTPAPNQQPVEGTVLGISVGDTINLDASSANNPLDLRYVMTGLSDGVMATSTPSDPRSTVGNEVFETDEIEAINLIGGGADDIMTVSSDLAYDIEQTGQRISFDGDGGTDKFEVLGTTGGDQVTIGDLAGDVEPFEVANTQYLRIEGGDGDDQLVNRTAVVSVIDSQGGSDTVLGGAGQDLLTGGGGVDFLFARGGNDVLFTDQDLADDTLQIEDGEIIDGGFETDLFPGDVCVQEGDDEIRNCEVLDDGGGRKDVLTWLRAIIVPSGSISFGVYNPVFDPFRPAFPAPVATLAVTEPSKLPPVIAPPPPGGETNGAQQDAATESSTNDMPVPVDPMDTNRDGKVSLSDALFVINQLAFGFLSVESELDWISQRLYEHADVNQDGSVEPLDALRVINYLARMPAAESSSTTADAVSPSSSRWSHAVDRVFDDDVPDDLWLTEQSDGERQLF